MPRDNHRPGCIYGYGYGAMSLNNVIAIVDNGEDHAMCVACGGILTRSDYECSQAQLDQHVRQRQTSHEWHIDELVIKNNHFSVGTSMRAPTLDEIYDKYANKWPPDWAGYEQAVAKYVKTHPEEQAKSVHPYDKMTNKQLLKLQVLMLLEAYFNLPPKLLFITSFSLTACCIWLGMEIVA